MFVYVQETRQPTTKSFIFHNLTTSAQTTKFHKFHLCSFQLPIVLCAKHLNPDRYSLLISKNALNIRCILRQIWFGKLLLIIVHLITSGERTVFARQALYIDEWLKDTFTPV